MKRRTQLKLRQLGVIIFAWLVIGFVITVYDYFVLHSQSSLGPSAQYTFLFALAMNSGTALTGALLGGSFLVFYVNVRYQDKPYGYTVIAVSVFFIFVIALIAVIVGVIITPVQTGNFLFDHSRTIKNTIVWSIVVGLTQMFLQMNSKFGYGVFWNIIRGKYNTPKEEKRIFMSLDINSSTSIAERLGDEKYHELLKDFFADITNPILDNRGEIYQYVGDEVIIAWKYDNGITDYRCVKCFFDMRSHMGGKKGKYLHRYGLVPTFKAGIHRGRVIVGEVGIIKRDITYSGDVMNTTARIRDRCAEFNVEVIVSEDLIGELSSGNPSLWKKSYAARHLGAIKLRGKEKEVSLSSLELAAYSGKGLIG